MTRVKWTAYFCQRTTVMFRNKQQFLRALIDSFGASFTLERIVDLKAYVDHGEYGLAIEFLSDWIYEEDVLVSPEQEAAILQASSDYGVDAGRHAFIGRTPPYPDLRNTGQAEGAPSNLRPTMQNVEALARSNDMLLAVKMYRELTGVGLREAMECVESLTASKQ